MAGAITWNVISDVETTDLGPGGTPARGHRVGFQLGDGTVGSVFVPNSSYTIEAVKAAIIAQAQVVAGVKGLSG